MQRGPPSETNTSASGFRGDHLHQGRAHLRTSLTVTRVLASVLRFDSAIRVKRKFKRVVIRAASTTSQRPRVGSAESNSISAGLPTGDSDNALKISAGAIPRGSTRTCVGSAHSCGSTRRTSAYRGGIKTRGRAKKQAQKLPPPHHSHRCTVDRTSHIDGSTAAIPTCKHRRPCREYYLRATSESTPPSESSATLARVAIRAASTSRPSSSHRVNTRWQAVIESTHQAFIESTPADSCVRAARAWVTVRSGNPDLTFWLEDLLAGSGWPVLEAGLGRDRLRADPVVRWRALVRVWARLGVKAAGGRRRGAVT
jgi:hypothetical protein